MTIINTGVMGIVFNFAPNFGSQTALHLDRFGAVGAGPATGLVYNASVNLGSQTAVLLSR